MKRLLLPAFVVAYTVLGAILVTQMPRADWSISGGKLTWDPYKQRMTVFVSSRNCVITMKEADFTRTKFVRQHPDGKVLARITGGKPTKLSGELPDGILLVNPSGVIVGPDAIVEPGGSSVLSTLDIEMEDFSGRTIDFSSDSKREIQQILEDISPGSKPSSAVELKAHGNVYALAIKQEGSIRANGRNSESFALDAEGKLISIERKSEK